MTILIRQLIDTDNKALLDLCALRSTGTELFKIDRSPSFFNFSKTIGHDARYFGAFISDKLIGCGGISIQKRKLSNDKIMTVGYVHDLRTHPDAPITAIKKLIEVPIGTYGKSCDLIMANVLDSNKFLKGFMQKRSLPAPYGNIPTIVKLEHIQFESVDNDSATSDFNISPANILDAYAFWYKYSHHFSLLEECVFDANQSRPYFIKNKQNEIIGLFNIIDQSIARNYIINKNQTISVKYLSNICGELSRDEIINIAGNFAKNKFNNHFIAYSRRRDISKYTSSTYLISNILIWNASDREINLNNNDILMDLNEI